MPSRPDAATSANWTMVGICAHESALKGGDRVKILCWDRGGFVLYYKRLERGTFAWPRSEDQAPVELRAAELMMLLGGLDVAATRRRTWYERESTLNRN